MKKWKTLSTKVVKKNPWWEYRLDRFLLPSGKKGWFHYMHTHGSVFIVAVRKDGKIAWLQNYRYLFQSRDWELPGGGVKEGQTPLEAARRELQEETGLHQTRLKQLGTFRPCNGLLDETCTAYLATDFAEGKPETDEMEQIKQHWLTFEEIERLTTSGKIRDAMSLAAWTIARPHVLKLIKKR